MPLPVCTVTGTLYLVGGAVAADVPIQIRKVLKNGVLLSSGDQTVRSSALGVVTLTLPRGSVAYLQGNVEGLNTSGGIALAIPDAATATLESLVPVTLIPATGLTHTFLSLADTPDTFVGQTLKGVRVNAGETGLEFAADAASGGAWGDITGTLADQTDLQAALDAKASTLGVDDNYVTDAEKVKLGNLSGTNTGDQVISGKANLTGGNTLTGNQVVNGNITFTDNTYDIGASGATRPRDLYLSNTMRASNINLTNAIEVGGTGYMGFTSRSLFRSTVNSKVAISNNAETGLQVLTLGNTAPATIGAAPANGQSLSILQAMELLTIAAAATTTTAMQVPAGAIVLGVSVRVTTLIPTAATFTVKIGSQVFNTAAVPVAAGSTDPGTAAGAFYNPTAAGVIITPNLTPGAATGVVRVTVSYILITPPTS